jgi:hypothetical protein
LSVQNHTNQIRKSKKFCVSTETVHGKQSTSFLSLCIGYIQGFNISKTVLPDVRTDKNMPVTDTDSTPKYTTRLLRNADGNTARSSDKPCA